MPSPKRRKGEKVEDWRSRIIAFYIREGKEKDVAAGIAYDETGTARKGMFDCSIIKQGEVTQWATVGGKRIPITAAKGRRKAREAPKPEITYSKTNPEWRIRQERLGGKWYVVEYKDPGYKIDTRSSYTQDVSGWMPWRSVPHRRMAMDYMRSGIKQGTEKRQTETAKSLLCCSLLKSGAVTDLLAFRPDVTCECPNCGTICKTETGVACYRKTCEKCGARMRQTGKKAEKMASIAVIGGGRIQKQGAQRFATIRGKKVPMASHPAKAKEPPPSDVPSAITTLGEKAEKAYREGADVARADLADTERKGTREHYRPMEIQRSVNESRQEAYKSPEHYAWWVGYRDVIMPYLEDKMRSETGQRW